MTYILDPAESSKKCHPLIQFCQDRSPGGFHILSFEDEHPT